MKGEGRGKREKGGCQEKDGSARTVLGYCDRVIGVLHCNGFPVTIPPRHHFPARRRMHNTIARKKRGYNMQNSNLTCVCACAYICTRQPYTHAHPTFIVHADLHGRNLTLVYC